MTLLSRAALETYADVHYDDNTTGEIVEEELRTGYKNLADSAVIKNEAGDLGAGLEWNADVIRIKATGVTLAMMENRAQATFIGRKAAAGTGAPQEMSATEAKTILAIAATDVSGLSAFATSTDLASATGTLAIARIADGTVTLAKIVNVTAARVLGRASGAGTGVATELAASDLSTILGLATIATSGSASDLGTGTLPIARIADGAVTLAKLENRTQATFIGRKAAAGTGVPQEMSASEAKTILAIANTDVSGLGTASVAATGTSGHVLGFLDGANTLSAQQVITITNTAAALILESTDAGALLAGHLVLRRTSASPAVSDILNGIEHHGFSSTGVERIYARTYAQIVLPTNAAENGAWYLDTIRAGTVTNEIFVAGGVQLSNPSGGFKGVGTLNALQLYQNGSLIQAIALSGSGADLTDATVTYPKIANGVGLSVIGRSANTSGVNSNITGTDGQVLRVSGTALGFGTIVAAGIASDAVTTVKILDANVTLAKMTNLAADTIIGRANGAGTGVPTALTATQVRTLLGLATIATSGSASDLGTGTLPIARIADGDVSLAKMANLAQSTIIGRAAAAGTGVPTALTAGQVSTILGLATIATSGSASDLGTGTVPDARLSGSYTGLTGLTITGSLTLSTVPGVLAQAANVLTMRPTTSDGSDTVLFIFGGGGAIASDRGAYIRLAGNEQAGVPGICEINAGDAGYIVLQGAIRNQTPTTYNVNTTFALIDCGATILHTSATAHAYTIPANATVAFPIGTTMIVCPVGTGVVTMTRAAGVSLVDHNGTDGNVGLAQYTVIRLIKVATNVWHYTGTT